MICFNVISLSLFILYFYIYIAIYKYKSIEYSILYIAIMLFINVLYVTL